MSVPLPAEPPITKPALTTRKLMEPPSATADELAARPAMAASAMRAVRRVERFMAMFSRAFESHSHHSAKPPPGRPTGARKAADSKSGVRYFTRVVAGICNHFLKEALDEKFVHHTGGSYVEACSSPCFRRAVLDADERKLAQRNRPQLCRTTFRQQLPDYAGAVESVSRRTLP